MNFSKHWFLPIGLVCLTFGIYTYFLHMMFWDDAYISLIYARNLANGEGLHWSGQRVEGYTNFLFVVLSAIGLKLGIVDEWGPRLYNFLSWLGIIYLVWKDTVRRYAASPLLEWLKCLAIILPGCSLPLVAWIFGGLESVFFAFLCLAALLRLLRIIEESRLSSPKELLLLGALLLLATLTRPEGLLITALTGMILLFYLSRQNFRPLTQWLALPLFSAIGIYAAWKYAYFGDILPNTYYAKVVETDSPVMRLNNEYYLFQYVFSFPLVFFFSLAGIFFCCWKKFLTPRIIIASVFVLGYLIYAYGVNADYMPYFRFILPAVAFNISLFIALMEKISCAYPRFAKEACAMMFVFALLQVLSLNLLNHEGAVERGAFLRPPFEAMLPRNATIALNAAGYLPYHLPQYNYIDMLGLNDRHIARQPAKAYSGAMTFVGHEKSDGAYVYSKRPDVVFTSRTNGLPLLSSDYALFAVPGFRENYQLLRADFPIPENKREFFESSRDYNPKTDTIALGFWVRKDRLSWFQLASEGGFRYREIPFSQVQEEMRKAEASN